MMDCRLACVLAFAFFSPMVSAADCNTGVVTINDKAPATPYPSPITISGRAGVVYGVEVDIAQFTHSNADDVGIALVAPSGEAFLIQGGASNSPISNVSYTLSDSASTQLPNINPFTAGSYRPAGYVTSESFPAPGPLLAYHHPGPAGGYSATFASTFEGVSPNGIWKLYVVDFATGDVGSIAGGWCVNLTLDADRIFVNGFES